MSAERVPSVAEAGLRLGPVEGERCRFRFAGSGETEGALVLRQFLEQLHEVALSAPLTEVVVDLADLTFINSACLKALISWVHKVDTTGRPYTIELIRDTKMHWQRGSLETLRRLAPAVVKISDGT